MTIAELLAKLAPTGLSDLMFPDRLLGAFRRKSITYANGLTDERTVVYWFQSKTFTIDLRLPDANSTAVVDRQGWVGDTLWDEAGQQLSWAIRHSYQPRNQWPEPAILKFIGNCVLEFAPSGAYVEDWRQQALKGPMLGLRLVRFTDGSTGQTSPVDGGLIIAGNHIAFAQSRLPALDAVLAATDDLSAALADEIISENDIVAYEVSVAQSGQIVSHSTRSDCIGAAIAAGNFAIEPDGSVTLSRMINGSDCRLHFDVDLYCPDFSFGNATSMTAPSHEWFEREAGHLMRHASRIC